MNKPFELPILGARRSDLPIVGIIHKQKFYKFKIPKNFINNLNIEDTIRHFGDNFD